MCNSNEICIESVCVSLDELENPIDQINHNNKRLEEELYTSHNNFDGPIRIHKYDVDSNDFVEEDDRTGDNLDSLILQPEFDTVSQDILDYPDSELLDIESKLSTNTPLVDDLNEDFTQDFQNLFTDDPKDDYYLGISH